MKKVGVRGKNREGVDGEKVYLCHYPVVQVATVYRYKANFISKDINQDSFTNM